MDHQAFAEMLGNYGEFFGAIAVVATLGYLAAQIRHNTRSVNSANIFNAMHLYNGINSMVVDNADVSELMWRGANQPESMSSDEANRFLLLMRAYNNNHFAIWWSHREGTMPEVPWEIFERNFAGLVSTPGGRRIIDSMIEESREYSEYLQELVDVRGDGQWTAERGWTTSQ